MTSVPVKKTGYQPKKRKNLFGEQRKMSTFPKQERRAKDFRNIGDTVKLHVAIDKNGGVVLGEAEEFAYALAGEFGRYEGERSIPLLGELCEIRIGTKVFFLPDDGKHFSWTD